MQVAPKKVAMLRVSKSGETYRPPFTTDQGPRFVRVNELAAEVHLNKLGVAALGEAIGDVLFPPRQYLRFREQTDRPRQKRWTMMQFLPRMYSADNASWCGHSRSIVARLKSPFR